jgi:hypothetical protein
MCWYVLASNMRFQAAMLGRFISRGLLYHCNPCSSRDCEHKDHLFLLHISAKLIPSRCRGLWIRTPPIIPNIGVRGDGVCVHRGYLSAIRLCIRISWDHRRRRIPLRLVVTEIHHRGSGCRRRIVFHLRDRSRRRRIVTAHGHCGGRKRRRRSSIEHFVSRVIFARLQALRPVKSPLVQSEPDGEECTG